MAISLYTKNNLYPRAADLARQLQVSRAAVALQLKSLKIHGLVKDNADKKIELTKSGADLVARIAHKRNTVRVFLREILSISPVTSELDACKIEHLISEETGEALVLLTDFIKAETPATKRFREEFVKFAKARRKS